MRNGSAYKKVGSYLVASKEKKEIAAKEAVLAILDEIEREFTGYIDSGERRKTVDSVLEDRVFSGRKKINEIRKRYESKSIS